MHQLDCRDLRCPLPIVRISQAVRDLDVGDCLQVLATDPAFRADLSAWAEMTGNELVSFEKDASEQRAVVRVR